MLSVFVMDTDVFLDDGLFGAACRELSEFRQKKIGGFRSGQSRRLSLGAGVLLDMALRPFHLREKDAAIYLGAHEKPFLQDRPELRFNLSHSGSCAVCALSDGGEVGVDAEKPGRAGERLIRRVCTPRELEALFALPTPEREEEFFRLWTVKESYMKLLGAGLSLGPKRLETTLSPAVSIRLDGAAQQARFTQWNWEGYWITLCSETAESPAFIVLSREDILDRYGS